MSIIDLSKPIRSKRVRGFQPPWYTVYIYKCPNCGNEKNIRASAFRGKHPEPGIGGVICGCCCDLTISKQFYEIDNIITKIKEG